MTSSCKKLFAFLLVQESLGTRVIPKLKQFKQPIWEEDEEGRRKAYFIFCTANHFYIIPDYALYHSRDGEAWVHQGRAVFVTTVCCTMVSDVWGGKVTATDFTASLSGFSLHPPLIIQGYEEDSLNVLVWSLCLSWWHIKKNPVKIKLSSSLLKNDIFAVQYRLK